MYFGQEGVEDPLVILNRTNENKYNIKYALT